MSRCTASPVPIEKKHDASRPWRKFLEIPHEIAFTFPDRRHDVALRDGYHAFAAKDVVFAVASTFDDGPYDANDTLSQAMEVVLRGPLRVRQGRK
jgi:hypothetical protein